MSGLISRPLLCLLVGLRPPPILSQVQWFLEPSDKIRVVYNNQTVAFNTRDTEGRLRNVSMYPTLHPQSPGVVCSGRIRMGSWGRGYNSQKKRMFAPPAVPIPTRGTLSRGWFPKGHENRACSPFSLGLLLQGVPFSQIKS